MGLQRVRHDWETSLSHNLGNMNWWLFFGYLLFIFPCDIAGRMWVLNYPLKMLIHQGWFLASSENEKGHSVLKIHSLSVILLATIHHVFILCWLYTCISIFQMFIYLLGCFESQLWHARYSSRHVQSFSCSMGDLVPWPGIELGSLHLEHGVLTPGPPWKSPSWVL